MLRRSLFTFRSICVLNLDEYSRSSAWRHELAACKLCKFSVGFFSTHVPGIIPTSRYELVLTYNFTLVLVVRATSTLTATPVPL